MTRWTIMALLLAAVATGPARADPAADLQDCIVHGQTLVKTDAAKVAAACGRLADSGNAEGELQFGALFETGQGVTQNFAKAAVWYKAAAEQGLARAQYSLGYMYERGVGVPQDNILAHLWYNLAAAQGIPDAAQARDFVAHRMSLSQIATAQKLAADWRPKPHS